jgi:hypothetical protein
MIHEKFYADLLVVLHDTVWSLRSVPSGASRRGEKVEKPSYERTHWRS